MASAQAPRDLHPAGTLDADVNEAQSRLRAMSHGYYSRDDWNHLYENFAQLLNRAESTQRDDLILQLSSSRALVQGQALGQAKDAVVLLKGVINRYRDVPDPVLRRIYVQLSELYADLGDEPAVARLIAEYRASNLNDPEPFTYQGGRAPGDAIQITRPHAQGDASLTVTAMENARKRALLASGRLAADFVGEDMRGRSVELRDYRGHVVLLDFFHPRWPGRDQSLSRLKQVYDQFNDRGFEIIGIPLVAGGSDSERLPWVLLRTSRGIASTYQVFGEATNFLVDQDGRIVGRNLSPSDIRIQLAERLKPEL